SSRRASSTAAPASSGFEGTRKRFAYGVGFTSSASGAPSSRSYVEVPFARMPSPDVAFACGSRSTTSARSPASARQAARLIALVVLPTPPFWFANAKTFPTTVPSSLRKRTFPCHARAARKAGRSGAELAQHEQTRRRGDGLSGQAFGDTGDMRRLGRLPDPEHDEPAGPNEGQAPLRSDGRRRERLRERRAGPVDAVLLGPSPDNTRVCGREPLQERALTPLRLEQDELAVGQRVRERNAGRAAAGTDVDERALRVPQQVD